MDVNQPSLTIFEKANQICFNKCVYIYMVAHKKIDKSFATDLLGLPCSIPFLGSAILLQCGNVPRSPHRLLSRRSAS